MKSKLVLLLSGLLLSGALGHAASLGTAFTYKGRLDQSGQPANGTYQMVVALYAGPVGGATLRTNSYTVVASNGLFAVDMDFGPLIFLGEERWLQIYVTTNGANNYVMLTPRTRIAPTPNAIYASTAGTVANGAIQIDQLGTVGAPPGPGQVLGYNGSSLAWQPPGGAASVWTLNGIAAYYTGGRVGIGTTTPTTSLEVTGDWTGEEGALRLTGDKPSIRFAGGPVAGNESWLLHVGGEGPGNLGFFRRAGPGSWTPIMSLNPGGFVGIGTTTPATKLTVRTGSSVFSGYGFEHTDGTVRLTTFVDGIEGWLGTRSNHPLNLFVNDGLPSLTIRTDGNVGIGKASPNFKLDVLSDTTTAIVGRSTVAGGIGVYGESSQYNGVRGLAHNANHGGVVGVHDGGGIAVYGTGATGVQGDSSSVGGYGGYFRNTAGGIALGVQGTARVGVLQITGGADLAEPFKMSHEHIAKGSVVVIDEEHPGQLKLSDKSYDQRVAGIVSGANGVNPGISLHQEGVLEDGQNVSLSGRVYVQADASKGSIKPGDLLTTSDTPGHAMKVSDPTQSQGAILGKAMSALKEGKGMVLVLVTLQ